MVHTVNERALDNWGSVFAERWEINITSLDAAGEETSFEPSEGNIERVLGVIVAGQENTQVIVSYDKVNQHLHFVDGDTGGDVAQGTDVGDLELIVVGK